jgi:hypothetical protein
MDMQQKAKPASEDLKAWSKPELVELISSMEMVEFGMFGPGADSITRPTS